ncbi:Dabb family protein [Ilumatobacter nonamiensis]|uniref:Dabb family protein n=1 Tax=Ilumatobacter nonamiensis TaxID=467093 RepID=UPI000347433A|nr:Dabb family protein [Ilumatobacter nonamiensis]
MIQHTVALRLDPAADIDAFWTRVDALREIPGVIDFTVLRQVGTKNDFTHALSMYFASQDDYDAYDNHPVHVAFVEQTWIPNVADFVELDYVVAED